MACNSAELHAIFYVPQIIILHPHQPKATNNVLLSFSFNFIEFELETVCPNDTIG